MKYSYNLKLNTKAQHTLILVIIFIAIFILNRLFPIYSDDWNYHFVRGGNTRVHSIADVFRSQYNHYFTWGGRSIVHGFLQFTFVLGEFWADLIFSIVYVLFIELVYRIINYGNKSNFALLIFINILLWFFVPDYSSDILWTTGCANYLFSALLILAFIYPYYKQYHHTIEHKNKSVIKIILFFIFGIIAGWTCENMALALLFFLIILHILQYKDQSKIEFWQLSGLIGAVIGTAILFLAPGNFIRYQTYDAAHISRLTMYWQNIKFIGKHMLYMGLPFYIGVLLIFFYGLNYKFPNFKKQIRLSFLFWMTSIVAAFVMVGAPIFPRRTWFGILVFNFIGCLIILSNFDYNNLKIRKVKNWIISIIILLFAYSYIISVKSLINVKQVSDKRELTVKKLKEQGQTKIVLHGQFNQRHIYWIRPRIDDLPPKTGNCVWVYEDYARYLGVKSIDILIK